MNCFLAFDVGTTAMKCILYDENFKEKFSANREYTIDAFEEGIAELKAEVYFETFKSCVKDILNTGIKKDDISSITFTTQGETLIPVDKNGEALSPAVVWLDTRAEKEAEIITEKLGNKLIYERTGLYGIDGALPAAKLMWFYNNRPEIFKDTYKFLLLEDYLIYRLTGEFVSEKSLQSSTGWYDIVNEKLFDEMIDVCHITEDKLPKILPCATVVANVKDDVLEDIGLGNNVVVTTGAMDQISSAIGVGNVKEGMFTETTGTALVAGITVKNPEFDENTPITVYKHYDDKFIYMPYSPTAGMSLKWFRDNIMPYAKEEAQKLGISSYEYVDKIAEKAPCASKGVVMLPQLSSEGAFFGLTLSSNTSDMARSVLEGVAYMLREITETVEKKGIHIDKMYSLGGGSYSPLWCSIKADICQKEFVCVDYAQTTALGAAILASVALGVYKSVEEALLKINVTGRSVEPDLSNKDVYDKGYQKYKKYLNIINNQEE